MIFIAQNNIYENEIHETNGSLYFKQNAWNRWFSCVGLDYGLCKRFSK